MERCHHSNTAVAALKLAIPMGYGAFIMGVRCAILCREPAMEANPCRQQDLMTLG
jgi:hypothetical protein